MFKQKKNDIIYKILSLYLKFKHKDEIIDIKKTFIESKKILVVLPSNKEQFEIALTYLPKIKNIFGGKEIFYVLPESFQSLFKEIFNDNPFFFQQKDITYFSLPSKRIINSLKKEKFDMSISLSPDFDLFCAYICLKSEAKLRIGLYDERGEHYFNFQVKKDGDNLLREKYNCLVKYLDMILNKD